MSDRDYLLRVTNYRDPEPCRIPESAPRIRDYLAPRQPEVVRPKLVVRAAEPVRFRETAGSTLTGRMVPYGEWCEIRNSKEGHFLERFAPGALAKTIRTLGCRS
jgi:hypothetical protein